MADATFEEFFSGGGGGGVDVGDVTLQPPVGTSYEKGAQFYLRTGLFVDKAAFPAAAATERCKVTGLPVTLPSAVTVWDSAHDGVGTIILAVNDSFILRSTDYGATWATVSTGMTIPATAVIHNGSRFILAGNNDTTIEIRRSNDGSSWSGGGTITSSGMGLNTVRGAWNGTIVMFIATNSVTGALTTTDGDTLTQRTLPGTVQTCFITAKGTTFVLGATPGGSIFTTVTGAGGSYTTIPNASLRPSVEGLPIDAVTLGATVLLIWTAGYYSTTTDLVVWVPRKTLTAGNNSTTTGRRPITTDGTRVYWGGATSVTWTDDGIWWALRPVTATVDTWHTIAGRVMVPSGNQSSSALKTADWTVPDYVGTTVGADVNASLVGFMRIR